MNKVNKTNYMQTHLCYTQKKSHTKNLCSNVDELLVQDRPNLYRHALYILWWQK